MVIFDENQVVSDLNKYEFLYLIYVKIDLTIFWIATFLKFMYSEKATKFWEISTVDLTGTT